MFYHRYGKRFLDIVISLLLIITFSPVIIVIIIMLTVVNRGAPFFFQARPGKNRQPITIIKFKSMTDEKDEHGQLLPDVQRMTRFGTFVRKTSLDELPQLFNVLIGDMSLVGPRPLLFKYLPLYSDEQQQRHLVRPGITGWAQVNGRNSISWTEKFKHDVYYVQNLSFGLDMKILLMTFLKVIKREGINQSKERPMQPFNGRN